MLCGEISVLLYLESHRKLFQSYVQTPTKKRASKAHERAAY